MDYYYYYYYLCNYYHIYITSETFIQMVIMRFRPLLNDNLALICPALAIEVVSMFKKWHPAGIILSTNVYVLKPTKEKQSLIWTLEADKWPPSCSLRLKHIQKWHMVYHACTHHWLVITHPFPWYQRGDINVMLFLCSFQACGFITDTSKNTISQLWDCVLFL